MSDKPTTLADALDALVAELDQIKANARAIIAHRDALRRDNERLRETLDRSATALNRVAWGNEFHCYIDDAWRDVNDALDHARAVLNEEDR